MNRNLLGLMLVAAFSLAAAPAQQPATPPAQTPAPAPTQPAAAPSAPPAAGQAQSDETPTIVHLGVNEVNLIFTVTDKHGHYIPNL